MSGGEKEKNGNFTTSRSQTDAILENSFRARCRRP